MSLSLEKGIPIAYVNGGKLKGKIVYLSTNKEGKLKDIKLTSGKFEPLMNPDTREVIYIAGPAGVGKSTTAEGLIQVYHALFPKSPIFLFSKLKDDPAFDHLQRKGIISRIVINEQLIEQPIEILDEVDKKYGALFIFDDTDTINNKAILT